METYIGEIKVFAFNSIPTGWLACSGQELAIADYQKLYSLLGDTFGGNGSTTFALPDLNGCVAVGMGGSLNLNVGAQGGSESVTLTKDEMAAHMHHVNATDEDGMDYLNQNNDYLATFYQPETSTTGFKITAYNPYSTSSNLIALNPRTIGNTGAVDVQAHENRMPYLAMSYCIAADGEYPQKEI